MKNIISIIFALLILTTSANAQTRKELEAKKKKTLQELAITNKLLNETSKEKKGTQNKVNLLKRSINKSNEYIKTLNSEINVLNEYIDSLNTRKCSMEIELNNCKMDYAKLSKAAYLNQKYNSPLIFILSADNFSQSIRRFRYLQEISRLRKKQALEIQQISNVIIKQEDDLTNNKIKKETAVSSKELETIRLENQKRKRDSELAALKRKESSLRSKQKKQEKAAAELNSKIQKIIAEEIRKQNSNKSTASSNDNSPYKMSKEEILVAGNFEKNKGKLPMPVTKGFISGKFGTQQHPQLKNVTINNKGIYIQTPSGSDARAIFEGEVTQCFSIPGSNNSVIVKHGNYRSVYSNLTTLYVKVGDKITTKQKIGKIFIDKENDNKTELYLMIYKDTTIQNPQYWLAPL